MPVLQFGSGVLFATPNAGNLALLPTPTQFGILQEVQVDISFENKKLYGRNQFPEDVARAKASVSGKAKFARLNGKQINDLFFGQVVSVGQTQTILDEGPTPIPTTPFHITVAGSATWTADLGVRNAVTGEPFTYNPGTLAQGQYNVAAGIYTFMTTDTGTNVLISYQKSVAATGVSLDINQQLMGFGSRFRCDLMEAYSGNQSNLRLYQCIATKLSRPTKTDDYMITEFDFECFADAAGNVMDFYDAV